MARTSTPPKAKPAYAGVCEALVSLSKGEFDAESTRLILGERTARTLPDVASAFGVRPSTVRQSWRQAGMPGSSGSYNLAEILLWVLERDRANEKYTKSTTKPNDRLAEIELEKAELDLEERRSKAREREGEMIPRWEARADARALLSVFKRFLPDIARNISPLMPENLALVVHAQLTEDINHLLIRLADEKIYGEKLKESYAAIQELIDCKKQPAIANGKAKNNARSDNNKR